MCKKCHGRTENSNGGFDILDFESFANMKVTFVRQISWMYIIR